MASRRTLQQQARMRRERRAWAKPYSMKASVGPNWTNGKQMLDSPHNPAKFLAAEAAAENIRVMNRGRFISMQELLKDKSEYTYFVQYLNTPTQRVRIIRDPKANGHWILWEHWRKGIAKTSIMYPTFTRAVQVWVEDRVRWRASHKIEPQ